VRRLNYVFVAAFSLVAVLSSSSWGQILRCDGTLQWDERKMPFRIDVSITPERSGFLFYKEDGRDVRALIRASEGVAQVGWSFSGGPPVLVRHTFLLTMAPKTDGDFLIGFVLDGPYVGALRVEMSKEGKPFQYYPTTGSALATGVCAG
jgi:hypothetical protein